MSESDILVVNMKAAEASPAFPKMKVNRMGWVDYGEKNDFPQVILKINSKSPVNTAIIESTVTYICGKGVKDNEINADKFVGVPNPLETWDELIEKLAKDYKIFGGFYLQVILSKDSKTVTLYHQDFSMVRIGQIDETGKPATFRVTNDWKKTTGKNKPIEIEAWQGIDKAKKGQPYMYHFFDYAPGLEAYCVPNYFTAIAYIEADGSLAIFYKNAIENNFAASAFITMPSNPDKDVKKSFQEGIEAKFTGPQNVNKIITLWGENNGTLPQITPFSAANNADIYNNIEGIIFQKIISAHRLSSPTLAGVSGSGNLSGNAAEIIDAYVLYNYTVIEKMRRKLLDKLNEFTRINGTAPLIIEELDVLPKIRETEAPQQTPSTEEVRAALETKENKFLKKISALWK